MSLPIAMQLYKLTPKGNETIRRTGWCPEHGTRSSQFLGVVEGGWQFRCIEKGNHPFVNQPDPHAPTTPEEIKGWKEAQRMMWLEEKEKGQ